ncbi:hypothetical protein [Rhodanobacter sp. OR92]|uniref:hypothetical protein n=1 Tax=Rhodanobacter sp. OR92 TaxID=1076524 RepID=UPI00047FD2FD|nr:hypothetical protein [Rhodanobacter sp. OR92]
MSTKTLWFRSWNDAVSYAANAGLKQRPQKRRVWLDRAWREKWSLVVPTDATESLTPPQAEVSA